VRRRRLVVVVFALVSGLFWSFAAFGANAAVSPGDEDGFVARIAAERSAAGLEGYGGADDLVAVARRHAARMAAEHRLFHNPSLGSDVTGWDAVGENVGVGSSVDDIHQAFMASAHHRDAILSSEFTQVGLGVEVDADGALWVVEVFRLPTAPAAAAPSQEDRGATLRAASSRRGASAAAVSAPPATLAPQPLAAPAPTTLPAAPPAAAVDPEEPVVAGVVAGAFDGTSAHGVLVALAPRPVARSTTPAPLTANGPARTVTGPISGAAALLLLVVVGLLVQVGRYGEAVSVWRRQRSQASMSSSRSPSSTAWTLPVS
jgi:hypothetical protein